MVRDIADSHRGLFLVCGITGSGKSTTLSSMVDYINASRHAHVITIEDPIEFVYRDKKAIISQRQVGKDTFSFANALRGALREDPDVIMVGRNARHGNHPRGHQRRRNRALGVQHAAHHDRGGHGEPRDQFTSRSPNAT